MFNAISMGLGIFFICLFGQNSLATAPAANPVGAKYQILKPEAIKRVELVQEFNPKSSDDRIELWIPTPTEDVSYQKVISREFSGNATRIRLEKQSSYQIPVIYVLWENVKSPYLKISNIIEVQDRRGPTLTQADASAFLQATDHVQTDGIVKATALKITKGLKDNDKKARAIYDWIVDNTVRDPNTRGCGMGDVKSLLEVGNFSGKCADLNSLFVGLARASGIPAREVWGLRVGQSEFSKSLGKEGDVSKSQHCRAEYFSKRAGGWVPVDPADIRKVILEEGLNITDKKIKDLREKFYGFWEGNWVSFNWGRDFEMPGYPKKINYFMYPLLLSAKTELDGVDPVELAYSFKSSIVK